MELHPASVVVIDISGYTQFIKLHRVAIIHAETVISELLEAVIAAASLPLRLNKIEGDAALFYARTDERTGGSGALVAQLQAFFDVFNRRELELVSECRVCVCDACSQANQLRLKIIAHHGDVVFKQVQNQLEIAGETVVIAHRLLKNTVPGDEYLLVTESFQSHCRLPETADWERRTESCEGFGKVQVLTWRPDQSPLPTAPATLGAKLRRFLRLEGHLVARLLGQGAAPYRNLPATARRHPPDAQPPSHP
jgi:class 3 adenylate cyclase